MENSEHSSHHVSDHYVDHKNSKGFPKMPPLHLEKVTFAHLKAGIHDIWGMVQLKKEVFEKVEQKHEEGIDVAFAYLLLATIAYPLGKFIIGDSYFGRLYRTTLTEFLFGVGFAIFGVVAVLFLLQYVMTRFFNGKASFEQFIRVIGYSMGFGILKFLTPLAGLVGLWSLVMTVFALKHVQKVSFLNAILGLVVTALFIGLISSAVVLLGFGFLLTLVGLPRFF